MKVLIVFGTRPEIIKLAPVIHKLKDKIEVKIVRTWQHQELAKDVIKFFKLKPDYNVHYMLKITEGKNTEETVSGDLKNIIKKEEPDLIIVQGDTRTTYTTAFIGFLLKKPILHLEAGLRTYNKFSPFPEEIFRGLVSRIADFHFAPTQKAYDNLVNEGIHKDRIFISGNTIVDATQIALSLLDEKKVFNELIPYRHNIKELIKKKKVVLITSHRRENIGNPLKQICKAVISLSKQYPETLFLWSLHKNPEVRKIVLNEMKRKKENIILTESLSYPTMIFLIKKSHIILTDSGGIQEETTSLNKPVLVLREQTERPEVMENGMGSLVGTDEQKIIKTFSSLSKNSNFHKKNSPGKNPFGDGKTSDRILKFLQLKEIKEFLKKYPESSDKKLKIGEL